MLHNDVLVNEHGIIEILVCGNQTVTSVQRMGSEAMGLAVEQKKSGRPVLVLDNLLEIGSVPSGALRVVVDLIKTSDYDRFAMVGNDSRIRVGANLILKVMGRSKQVRYFEDYGKATLWLLEDSDNQ